MRLRFPVDSATRGSGINMTPMIDAVFLLLIFFMLTLRIIAPEGNLDARVQRPNPSREDASTAFVVRVRCTANPDGSLAQLYFGADSLGADAPACWERLNSRLFRLTGSDDPPEMPVQIEADPNLAYEHTLHALSACTGRIDPDSGRLIRCSGTVSLIEPRR